MKLDGFGLFVKDMAKMLTFYRDVLGFEIKRRFGYFQCLPCQRRNPFMLYGRKDFEK